MYLEDKSYTRRKGMKIKMKAKFKSKTISNYYTGNPDNYILSFHHYNIVVDNDSKEEYYLLEKDIELLRKYNKENSILYFSDINNLKKIKYNTNICNNLNDIYLRIRNKKEYEEFKKLDMDINIIIELNDLENIQPTKNKITLQIDAIRELPVHKLKILKMKYNIVNVLLGQIQYITNEYADLLDILSNQFGIEKSNQLELEKNNNVTNDIYDISTYIKIYNCIDKIINQNKKEDLVETIYSIFLDLANNISYDDDGVRNTKIENQNLIGPLFYKKAVCEGYSKLFQQILSILNIKSLVVSGGGRKVDGGHVWNQVEINGVWYNADVTAQSYAVHNNENWNMFLREDKICRYQSSSPFAKKCLKNYYICENNKHRK